MSDLQCIEYNANNTIITYVGCLQGNQAKTEIRRKLSEILCKIKNGEFVFPIQFWLAYNVKHGEGEGPVLLVLQMSVITASQDRQARVQSGFAFANGNGVDWIFQEPETCIPIPVVYLWATFSS